MAATIETKEIGISLNCSDGKYINTEYVEGKLALKKKDGLSIYEREGYWESCVLDVEGKFRDYDKLAITKTQFTKDLYKVETRTSDDEVTFNEYVSISAGGSILSPKKRYIQVKITFYAGFLEETIDIFKFSNELEKNKFENNELVDTATGLKLKTDYTFNMSKDNAWTNEGTLLRQVVQATRFKHINTLRIE